MFDSAGHPEFGDDLAIVEANEFGRVTAVNQRFSDEFGWKREAIIGRPLHCLAPAQLHDAFNARFSRFVEFGEAGALAQPLSLPVVTAEGETVMAEVCLQAERTEGHWRLSAQLERFATGGKAE